MFGICMLRSRRLGWNVCIRLSVCWLFLVNCRLLKCLVWRIFVSSFWVSGLLFVIRILVLWMEWWEIIFFGLLFVVMGVIFGMILGMILVIGGILIWLICCCWVLWFCCILCLGLRDCVCGCVMNRCWWVLVLDWVGSLCCCCVWLCRVFLCFIMYWVELCSLWFWVVLVFGWWFGVVWLSFWGCCGCWYLFVDFCVVDCLLWFFVWWCWFGCVDWCWGWCVFWLLLGSGVWWEGDRWILMRLGGWVVWCFDCVLFLIVFWDFVLCIVWWVVIVLGIGSWLRNCFNRLGVGCWKWVFLVL